MKITWVLDDLERKYLANRGLCNGAFFAAILLYFVIKKVIVVLRNKRQNVEYEKLIKQRQAVCEKSFEKSFDVQAIISPEVQKKILRSDIKGLRKMLLSKEITATNLLKFYYMRAKTIGRDIKAAIESNIDEALIKAAEADKIFAKNDPNIFEKYPVLGIPFSVKESYAMKGFDTTQGFPTRINHPSTFTAPLIQEVIDKGGIAFVRTNFPQALMTVESENDIYGICRNIFNKDRVVGGSSGGEGAIVGSLCSPFGIGSDIGGSIRNPAHNNGIMASNQPREEFALTDILIYHRILIITLTNIM